jgi:hypothetical protein
MCLILLNVIHFVNGRDENTALICKIEANPLILDTPKPVVGDYVVKNRFLRIRQHRQSRKAVLCLPDCRHWQSTLAIMQ